MPKRNIHFIWRQRGQNEEDEIIRKQNSFQKEKPYTTLEFRIPKDRWEWENNTSDFFERYPDKENDHQLHPLRKQYLENRLKDIDYQERTQTMQDNFTTAMYGKKDYTQEKNNIMQKLIQGRQSLDQTKPSYKINGEKLWQDIRLQQDRDKANGKPFQIQSLEEWKAKDAQYQRTQPSHCNTATGSILKEKGIDVPANESMNDIINFMENSSEWQKIPRTKDNRLDHQTANRLAQQGQTVVFGYNNPDGHGHGGVLTGNPQMFESKNFKDKEGNKIPVPEVKGSIGQNDIATQHLGYHLSSDKEANTNYYVYKGNQNKDKYEKQKNE